MKKLVGIVLGLALLTGCSAPAPEATATPSPSVSQKSLTEILEAAKKKAAEEKLVQAQREFEQRQAEKEAEALRLAEEKRLAEEAAAEQQRIADLEAENQRKQKEAADAEILRQQQEAARQLAERLEREKPSAPLSQPAPAPAPAPATGGYAWINSVMAQYGVYPSAGTSITITDGFPSNCAPNAVGCFTAWQNNQTGEWSNKQIWIRPSEVGSDPFILFHEIAHSHRIVDECSADNWARQYLPGHAGAYC